MRQMTRNNILILVAKFLGIYFLAKGIFSIREILFIMPYVFNAEAPNEYAGIAWNIASSVFSTVFYLVVAIITLRYAHVFINKASSHYGTNLLSFIPETDK